MSKEGSTLIHTTSTDTGEKEPSSKPAPDTVQDVRALPPPPEQPTKRRKKHTNMLLILAAIVFIVLGGSISLILILLSRHLTLTEADADRTVQVHPGDQITIQLQANATTGFQWVIDKTDTTVLTLQSSTYTPYPAVGGIAGRGGTQAFTFKVQQPGTVHLHLKYWRSWEGDSSIARRYDVTIQVQG